MSNEDPYEGKVSWWKVTEKIIRYIIKKIRKYRDENINPILENEKYTEEEKKEKLVDQLRRIRSIYNVWNGFASGFTITFFATFITLLFGKVLPENIKNDIGLWALAIIFIIVSVVQTFFLCTANMYYEEMEVVKAELKKIKKSKSKCEETKALEAEFNEMKLIRSELEKINNTVQPNPKKTSIRIYNRSSVRRSNFGR